MVLPRFGQNREASVVSTEAHNSNGSLSSLGNFEIRNLPMQLWLHDDQACFESERGSVRCARIEAVGFGERQRRTRRKRGGRLEETNIKLLKLAFQDKPMLFPSLKKEEKKEKKVYLEKFNTEATTLRKVCTEEKS
jgi:hypothetical protein